MNKQQTNKNFKLTNFVIGLILALCLVQLFISHRLATAGQLVKELEIKASRLEQENTILGEEISQNGSLSLVAQRASGLGFVRTSNILYLTSQIPVALGTSNISLGR